MPENNPNQSMEEFETVEWEEIKDDIKSVLMNKDNFEDLLKRSCPDDDVEDLVETIDDDSIVRIKFGEDLEFEAAHGFAHFEDESDKRERKMKKALENSDDPDKLLSSEDIEVEEDKEPPAVTHLEEDEEGYFFPDTWMLSRDELTNPNLKKEYPDRITESELIRRKDAEEYYGNETFSIGHWIDIGEYRERQNLIEMLEERMGEVDSLENQIVAGKERHHRLDELDKLKQKLKEGEN